MKTTYKESDMYAPIRQLLSQHGFTVRGEVKGCDIAAVKENTLWVVEMKLSANLTLIYQALERQTATDWVFVAIPRPRSSRDGNFRKLQKLLKKLQLGLITVALDSPAKHAEIILFPTGRDNKETKKAKTLRKEISGRTSDTPGGTVKSAVNTAYRERCIRIACLLEQKGPLKARELVNIHNCEKDASAILRLNVFGWFDKVSTGLYRLSPTGQEYLESNEATSLVVYYRMRAGFEDDLV